MVAIRSIGVVVIDDHALMRMALRLLLDPTPNFKVVGEASNRAEALKVVGRVRPEIILLDLDLGDESGLDLLPELLAASSDSRVIVLTGLRDPDVHRRAVENGAVGLVSKEKSIESITVALEKVQAGETWFDPSLFAEMLALFARERAVGKLNPEAAKIASLTEREREVVAGVCKGLQNRQIGDQLGITETTVRHHLTSIFGKLGVASRLELVIYAFRHGLAAP